MKHFESFPVSVSFSRFLLSQVDICEPRSLIAIMESAKTHRICVVVGIAVVVVVANVVVALLIKMIDRSLREI